MSYLGSTIDPNARIVCYGWTKVTRRFELYIFNIRKYTSTIKFKSVSKKIMLGCFGV